MTLNPGDMITSGTPAGTAIERGVDGAYLKAGNVVEVEVEGVGILRNTVVARS
jgi:2-keto-4-pentenoate hydratase/2-oxohepta-3-ene-1,7-dioic acid hydratase in catechol pathway